MTRRLLQREILPPFGGWKGQKLTRSLVFSRFRPWRSYRDESGRPLTCSVFPKGPPGRLWAGSDDGSVHLVSGGGRRKRGEGEREGWRWKEGGRDGIEVCLPASVHSVLPKHVPRTHHPSLFPAVQPLDLRARAVVGLPPVQGVKHGFLTLRGPACVADFRE